MPGLLSLLRDSADAASRMADGIRGAREEVERIADAAVAPSQGAGPGPLTGGGIRQGATVAVPPASQATRVGGGGGGGGNGGGGGGDGGGLVVLGAGIKNDPFLRSTDGQTIRPLSWIEANCSLVDQPIYNSLGAPSGRTRRVWNCGDHGVFLPVAVDALGNRVSATSSGGGGGGAGGGSGAGGPGSALGDPYSQGDPFERTNPYSQGDFRDRNVRTANPYGTSRDPGSTGPTSITGDVRAPGVEEEIRRTNQLLERSLRDDGGAAIRAGGGL